jgi:hypothetical protein
MVTKYNKTKYKESKKINHKVLILFNNEHFFRIITILAINFFQ